MSGADLLANVERSEHDRPTPAPEEPAPPGYWPGSAVAEVERWKQRALLAEAAVSALRHALARYRVRP